MFGSFWAQTSSNMARTSKKKRENPTKTREKTCTPQKKPYISHGRLSASEGARCVRPVVGPARTPTGLESTRGGDPREGKGGQRGATGREEVRRGGGSTSRPVRVFRFFWGGMVCSSTLLLSLLFSMHGMLKNTIFLSMHGRLKHFFSLHDMLKTCFLCFRFSRRFS